MCVFSFESLLPQHSSSEHTETNFGKQNVERKYEIGMLKLNFCSCLLEIVDIGIVTISKLNGNCSGLVIVIINML